MAETFKEMTKRVISENEMGVHFAIKVVYWYYCFYNIVEAFVRTLQPGYYLL